MSWTDDQFGWSNNMKLLSNDHKGSFCGVNPDYLGTFGVVLSKIER